MTETTYREITDAITNLEADNIVTRDLIILENTKTLSKLEELETQIKIMNLHLSTVTNDKLDDQDVE